MYYSLRGDGWEDVTMAGGTDVRGYAHDGDVSVAIDAGDEDFYSECPNCNAYIDDDADETQRPDEDDELHTHVDGHEDDCTEPDWRPAQGIGRRFNAAGVSVDESQDRVQLWVSVGDPRGAFVMNLELIGDELRLSVPTPEDSFLHCPLTQLGSPGYYRVGS